MPAATCDRRYRYVEAWGMAAGAYSRVLRPRSVEEIRAAFADASREGVPLALRGSGQSYGDASLNGQGSVLEPRGMDRILAFDEGTGVAEVEPGVTVEDLWRYALPRGFWPRVVSGTMFPTIAGAAAMNIHGKNNFAVGTIGDAILAFDLVLPSGELVSCSREENPALFHAAIGGFGMLGVFTRIVLRTKRVHSGLLEVHAVANRNLREALEYMDGHRASADYLVAWIDCFGRDDGLGRGTIHDARYLAPGEDEDAAGTLQPAYQELPSSILGFPKSEVWRILRLLNHDPGIRLLNFVKYVAGRTEEMRGAMRWTHAEFAFLLDYVPNWKWCYGRHERRGLIQHQIFVPHAEAHATLTDVLRRNQARGFVPYLGVLKRHRPDPFLLTHAVDGWSLAQDFKVTPARRAALWKHCDWITERVLDAGGRFYFAKDLVIGPEAVRRMYPPERLAAFLDLKRALDPRGLLQTDLWRRLFRSLYEERFAAAQ